MGYTTDFTGAVQVEPPLTEEQIAFLTAFSEERHGGNTQPHAGFPGFWCDWVPTADGAGIEWNGTEKFYDSDEWMQLIIDRFIAPTGRKVNGTIEAQGEDPSDIWRLKVTDNVVSRVAAKIVWEDA